MTDHPTSESTFKVIDMMPQEANDPRVILAAERTLLAWIRTALALMGFGFLVARFSFSCAGVAHFLRVPEPVSWTVNLDWFRVGTVGLHCESGGWHGSLAAGQTLPLARIPFRQGISVGDRRRAGIGGHRLADGGLPVLAGALAQPFTSG